MGAIGAVGGIGGSGGSGDGGLGSIGGDAGAGFGWFDAASVMATSGSVDGSNVTLGDGDLHGGVGTLGKDERIQPPPPQPTSGVAAPNGPGEAPTSDVVSQVAACYAANQLP